MKKPDTLVREYVRRLSDDDLHNICTRLSQHVAGDWAECAMIFERDKEINRWLLSANGADEWFDMVDSIGQAAGIEMENRSEVRSKEKRDYRKRD